MSKIMVVQTLSLRAAVLHVSDVSLIHMDGSASACHPGLLKSVNDSFILIRCTEAGKHGRHAGQLPSRTGVWRMFDNFGLKALSVCSTAPCFVTLRYFYCTVQQDCSALKMKKFNWNLQKHYNIADSLSSGLCSEQVWQTWTQQKFLFLYLGKK